MITTIQFIAVSKKYNLGMTRKSLPVFISTWAKSTLHRTVMEVTEKDDFWALRKLSFELKKGDSLALVGANGAGKTTILKLLANITKPTSGKIHINGKLSALIELGAGFHPDLSGRENIYLNGSILGLKKNDIAKRFDSIVSFAELEQFIDTPVKRYSSGMAVRLGFSVAASIDPDILLVDEVLAVGDSAFRLKCMNRIQELIDNGTTLVFVSHNMGLVKAVCEKAIYLEKGIIKKFGQTSEVIEAYNRALNEQRISEFEGIKENLQVHSTTCEITKIVVTGKDGESNLLLTHHPTKISIHYQAYHDLGEISVVVRMIRSDGVACATLYSHVDQIALSIGQGVGEIFVTLSPLQLFPGTYYVAVTIKNKKGSMVHDMAYSNWFHVEGRVKGYEDLDAVYEPNRTWTHQPFLNTERCVEVNSEQES